MATEHPTILAIRAAMTDYHEREHNGDAAVCQNGACWHARLTMGSILADTTCPLCSFPPAMHDSADSVGPAGSNRCWVPRSRVIELAQLVPVQPKNAYRTGETWNRSEEIPDSVQRVRDKDGDVWFRCSTCSVRWHHSEDGCDGTCRYGALRLSSTYAPYRAPDVAPPE